MTSFLTRCDPRVAVAVLLVAMASAGQAQPADLPRIIQEELRMIQDMCPGGFHPDADGAVRSADINADRQPDYLLAAEPMCPNDRMMVCGAANCQFTLFTSGSAGWQRFDYILPAPPRMSSEGFFLDCPDGNPQAGVFMEGGALVQRSC